MRRCPSAFSSATEFVPSGVLLVGRELAGPRAGDRAEARELLERADGVRPHVAWVQELLDELR